MNKTINCMTFTACIIAAAVHGAIPAWAQGRTTPVEVTNLLGIDPSNNTVKAQQLGTWSVSLSGTAAVTQSGSWNVGITGTPNVNVANTPTVNINATNNIVKAPTQRNSVMLWNTDQSWPAGQYLWGPWIDCAGYKEARVTIQLVSYVGGMDMTQLEVIVRFGAPDGSIVAWTGHATFGTPAHSLTDQSGFTNNSFTCSFTIPVMSDTLLLQLYNSSPYGVDISRGSWVYLVN
ncbi:MAG: hypothetical protein HYX78_14865 [Armatimonadetes bacterium]|nr:hypothetical protein [Armatimonadota bacterium]